MTHADYEAILARVEFEERAALWLQRAIAFAGVFVLVLLLGELI
jgi:hypothetical protein